MIQVAVVSGKGGTGKTILTASLASLLPQDKVLIDADVDAANLALLLDPVDCSADEFRGMDGAFIDPGSCVGCGICAQACNFEAIQKNQDLYEVVPYRCEGCGTCVLVCPEDAVQMQPRVTGRIHYAQSHAGPLLYGSLTPGSGNSGLLVHRLRQEARVKHPDVSLVLIDGPPGIGCPLISTITGIQVAILVTEPSKSAKSDLMRLITLCRSFQVRMYLVINRYDVNADIAKEICQIAAEKDIHLLGMIPYDLDVLKATRNGIPVSTISGHASEAIHQIAKNLSGEIDQI
ncbi:MAG: P-loop NTPase [Methanomicrobiales archaeon]|jgi:MinD superfamily P-loop ATPase|nr:P-loop NTPase [Methanomicrobiales archaeon]